MISCYISPNVTMNEFLEALDELEEEIRTLKRRIIIIGDFNS